MIKKSIQEKEKDTIVNIHAPNIRASKYMKQIVTDINREIDSNKVIKGNLIIHLHLW